MNLKRNPPLLILLAGIGVFAGIALLLIPSVHYSAVRIIDDHFVPQPIITDLLGEDLEEGIVNRVIDGDTIVLEDGRTIRYLYVDTPETVKPNTPEQCYGKEATEFNKKLVNERKVVLKRDKEDTDRYGRHLRIVFLEGVDYSNIQQSVNAQIVLRGYGKAKAYSPNTTFKQEFEKYEKQAQRDVVGLWNACNSNS